MLLFPAVLLILLGLGLVTIDAATVFTAQRTLFGVSELVADEVVAGIDVDRFLAGDGELVLDPARSRSRVEAVIGVAAEDVLLEDLACRVDRIVGLEVTVTCTARAGRQLAPTSGDRVVSATTTVRGVLEGGAPGGG